MADIKQEQIDFLRARQSHLRVRLARARAEVDELYVQLDDVQSALNKLEAS